VQTPSRSMTSVEGTFNGLAFQATLEPDVKEHWLKVDRKMREERARRRARSSIWKSRRSQRSRNPGAGRLRKALMALRRRGRRGRTSRPSRAEIGFTGSSPQEAETRARRIGTACDMLAKGKRRPCCFDSLGCMTRASAPVADDTSK